MSLWAWVTYYSTYTWVVLKEPFAISLWQQLYNLNVILVVQETTDVFGLVCLGVLFLCAHHFYRNTMLAIMLLSPKPNTLGDGIKTKDTPLRNKITLLSTISSVSDSLKSLFTGTLKKMGNKIRP